MKLKDLRIGTQLRLGMGLILVLVAALGGLAWRQTHLLWSQTQMLYDHPFQVRGAVGRLEVDVEQASGHLRGLALAKTEPETLAALQGMEIAKADAERQLAIVSGSYLGPREDLVALRDNFVKWNVLCGETASLLRSENRSSADVGPAGVQNAQGEAVRNCLKKIDDFAQNKGGEFYQAATEQHEVLSRQLAATVAIIFLLALLVAWLLMRGIRVPVKKLTAAMKQFRQGDLEVRSRQMGSNEFGALAGSFNAMADAIQAQIRVNESSARLADAMLRQDEMHGFCREMLQSLLEQTGSQIAAVYFLNDAQTTFEHFESIGLGAGGRAAFSATTREGEMGAVLATRQIQRITDIPTDTPFAFAAVSGDFTPREILTIPILADQTVLAVVSLASLRAYDAPAVDLVYEIWSMLTARINGVLAFQKSQNLAQRLEHQNRELDAQKQELSAQAGELTEHNTELEMQKCQLDEANRLKSAFLSNMSHELRTPLNSVIALAGVLNRRLRPASEPASEPAPGEPAGSPADPLRTIPAEEYGYLAVIERNGKSLLKLINDILDLSRIEAGREEVSLRHFSAREMADDVVAMIEPQAVEKKVVLRSEVSADLPPLVSDPDKCRHILQNLVANAVKFTEQGQVTISAGIVAAPHSEFHISVRDTGIGIAADQLPYIFDEFRQADDSTSRKYGGTGLGLAIARKYAALLGGRITVESSPGQGSTFTLRLPLESPAAPAETWKPAAQDARPTPSASGQRILLVEDNGPAIIQLTHILQAEGYQVLVARNGQEALAQIQQAVPEAMILDLMMPEVDGFQVLRAIRGATRTEHLPVLILTAKHVTKEELSFLKGNSIHQLIQKGDINRAGLLAAVARMVAPAPLQPPPRQLRRAASPPVVLLVEDNPDSRCAVRALLQNHYQLIEAPDGQEGVRQARACRPNLILMDISMPVMDGVQALREIRGDSTLRHTPVIALTASAMKGDRETILAHGFDGYLAKPLDEELLKKTLAEALD